MNVSADSTRGPIPPEGGAAPGELSPPTPFILSHVARVVWRDQRMISRRKGTYWIRILLPASLLFTACLAWFPLRGSHIDSLQGLARLGNETFRYLVAVGYAAAVLLAPAYAAGVIPQERERGTLTLILITRLGGRGFLLGTYLSRLATVGWVMATALPFLFSCMLLGGVGAHDILTAMVDLLSIALMSTSVTLFCSVSARKAGTALARSCLLVVAGLLLRWWIARDVIPSLYGLATTPSLGEASTFVPAVMRWVGVLVQFRTFCLTVAVASLALALILFPRFATGEPGRRFSKAGGLLRTICTRVARFIPACRPIEEVRNMNPIAWAESQSRRGSLGPVPIAILILGTDLILLLADSATLLHPDIHALTLIFLWPVWHLVVSVRAASTIAREKDRGTWDLILATPLSGGTILLGKAGGVIRSSLPWLWIMIYKTIWLTGCTMSLSADEGFLVLLFLGPVAMLALTCSTFFHLALGVFLSLRTSSLTHAVTATLVVAFILNIAVPGLGILLTAGTTGEGTLLGVLVGIHLLHVFLGICFALAGSETFDHLTGRCAHSA